MVSGNIAVKEDPAGALNRAQLLVTSDGFNVERVGQGLVVTLSEIKDFMFQTQPGKIFWSKLVLEPSEGSLHYSFVYRFQMQAVIHLFVTAACFLMLRQIYSPSDPNLWLSVLMINVIVAVVTLGSAFHSKTKILKKLKTKI